MKIFMPTRNSIIVAHKGEELEFFIHRTFARTALVESFDPGRGDTFNVINEFLGLLSDDRAENLFRLYKRWTEQRKYHLNKMTPDHHEQNEAYRRTMKEIFTVVSYDSVREWMEDNVVIEYPPTIEEVIPEGLYPDRTYVKRDYQLLCALGLTIRLAVPIMAQYIYDHGDSIGNDRKELMALKLLDMSDIIHTEPYKRFVVFVEAVNACVADVKNTFKTIMGVGSEEQLEISKARKIVRRVAFINPLVADGVIQAVFNEIKNQPTDTQRSQNRIKDKKKTGSRSDEDESSIVEQYRIKEELPKGDIRAISYYLEKLIKSNIFDRKEVKKLTSLSKSLIADGHEMDKHNLMMAMFFIKGVPPESLDVVDREFQISACVVVYGIMMKWGYHDLAILALGKLDSENEDALVGASNRATIPADLDKRLDDLYPYRRKAKNVNVCKEAISALFGEVSGCLIRPIYHPDDHDVLNSLILYRGLYSTPRTVAKDLVEAILKTHTE